VSLRWVLEQTELIKILRFRFDVDRFYRPLDEAIPSVPADLRDVANAFRENLRSVLVTVGLPSQLLQATKQALPQLENLTVDDLTGALLDPALLSPTAELVRGGTVLTWTALEVLATDLFIQLLNLVPDLSVELMKDERIKKRFQLQKVPLETIDNFGFDLSKKMGLVFTHQQTIDSAQVMREVFAVLFPESEALRALLQNDRLWLLYHRRNLIVHHRALVDEAYLASTGERLELGSQLDVTLADVITDLELIKSAGIEMLRAVPARLSLVPPVA
jgi:hypothetical protein